MSNVTDSSKPDEPQNAAAHVRMKPESAALPWHYCRSGYGSKHADFDIVNALGGRVASTPYEAKAAQLVHAINAYPRLVEALKDASASLNELAVHLTNPVPAVTIRMRLDALLKELGE